MVQRLEISDFRFSGSGFGDLRLGFKVWGFGLRVWDLGLRV